MIRIHALRIELNGRSLSASHANLVAHCRIQHRLSRPSLCEITIERGAEGKSWPPEVAVGATLRVVLAGEADPLFTGEVTAVESVYQADRRQAIRFRGYDLLHRLRKQDRFEARTQTTLEQLASDLIAEADPSLHVEADTPGPVLDRVIQAGESDYQFLVGQLAASGLYLTVWGQAVHLVTLAGVGDAVTLTWGENLWECIVECNADLLCRSVRRAGWELRRIESFHAECEEARGAGTESSRVDPGVFGRDGRRIARGMGVGEEADLLAAAQADLDRSAAGERRFWGIAQPDFRLRPGARVDLRGLDDPGGGEYVLTSVTHQFDPDRGVLTELDTEPPDPLPPAAGWQVLFGVVTSVADPAGLGRVKSRLDHVNGLETDWMQVVLPAAGSNKGLVALPDVDDHVLILCPAANPARGLVVGGVYGGRTPPDDGVADGRIQRYTVRTPGGQQLSLDDVKQRVRLENDDGSFFEAAPEQVTLHAATDLMIEAPGRRITIRGDRVDFLRAT